MKIEFKLPELGEGVDKADVVAVLVEAGQVIQPETNELELETGKAVMELPCPHGGTVVELKVEKGDSIEPGQVVLVIESTGEQPDQAAESQDAPASQPTPPPKEPEPTKPEPLPTPESAATGLEPGRRSRPAPAGPATRKLARELGVDLYDLQGSGRGGRITTADVRAFVKAAMTSRQPAGVAAGVAQPALPEFSRWGEVAREPMSAVRKATVESMSTAWRLIPHVTHHDKADVTELEAARKRYNASRPQGSAKITMTALLMKAVVATLKAFPNLNASIDTATHEIIHKRYYALGIAVDTSGGLLVPVIRDVDRKSALDLAAELGETSARARDRKLKLEEMQGGTFTISNLGGIGGTGFTPIVAWPQVAILGVSRSAWEFVPDAEHQPVARFRMPLSLSYDHRLIDGADAARALRHLAEVLSDPMRLLLSV